MYKVTVERLNRLQTILLLCVTIFVAFGSSSFLNEQFGIEIRGEILFLAIVLILCVLMIKLERFFPMVEEVQAVFGKESVVFKKGRRERIIFYADIREVEKIMIINRYHSEKGYYRVKIKMRGFSYTLYSGEDSSKELDFEETGLSKIYFEFRRRGVKCC